MYLENKKLAQGQFEFPGEGEEGQQAEAA